MKMRCALGHFALNLEAMRLLFVRGVPAGNGTIQLGETLIQ